MARLSKIVSFRGIKTKFILLILALMATVFAAVTFILVDRTSRTLRGNLSDEAKAFASLATKPIGDTYILYNDSGHIRILQQMEKFADLNSNVTNIAVIGSNGNVLFSQKPNQASASVPAEMATSFEPTYRYDTGGRLYQVVYPYLEDFGLRRYTVVYSISSNRIEASVREVVNSLIVLGLGGLSVAALLIYVFVNRFLLHPLKNMSKEALAISQGQFDRQIKLKRNDEIADLGNSINTMAKALRADIQKLKEVDELKSEFMVIASHNLRTPLTIMEGNLELLRENPHNENAEQFMNALAVGTRRLKQFATDMLTISQIEAGKYSGSLQSASLRSLLEPLVEEFTSLTLQKNINFKADIRASDHHVNYNLSYLRAAFWNILDNALKFTPTDGTIDFNVRIIGDQMEIKVADTGTGIDPKEMPHLFTKFRRGTDIMHYDYDGTGLGLYLTKLVIDQHKGNIFVESHLDQGTTITITLPLADDVSQPSEVLNKQLLATPSSLTNGENSSHPD